jgi:arylsulfatase A-like enzyme
VVTDFVLKGRDPSKLRIPLLHALIQDGWKYVESMLDRRIQPELYNLAQDPLERHNLYSACRDSALVKRFVEELRTIEDQHAVAATSLNPDGSVLASA